MKRDELCIKTVVLAWLYNSRVRSDEKREGSRAARHVAYSRACIFVYHINVRETGDFPQWQKSIPMFDELGITTRLFHPLHSPLSLVRTSPPRFFFSFLPLNLNPLLSHPEHKPFPSRPLTTRPTDLPTLKSSPSYNFPSLTLLPLRLLYAHPRCKLHHLHSPHRQPRHAQPSRPGKRQWCAERGWRGGCGG